MIAPLHMVQEENRCWSSLDINLDIMSLQSSLDVTTRSTYDIPYFTVLFERHADEASMSVHSCTHVTQRQHAGDAGPL